MKRLRASAAVLAKVRHLNQKSDLICQHQCFLPQIDHINGFVSHKSMHGCLWIEFSTDFLASQWKMSVGQLSHMRCNLIAGHQPLSTDCWLRQEFGKGLEKLNCLASPLHCFLDVGLTKFEFCSCLTSVTAVSLRYLKLSCF